MKGLDMKFFWLPREVIYYVVIPMLLILVAYFIFNLIYKKKKGTKYYNYVVDYVYSTLGIIFCGLLFSLLLGYSIATLQILIVNRIINDYILLAVILVILPIIPTFFLIFLIRIYVKNIKRKDILDKGVELKQEENEKTQLTNTFEEVELVKKKS